METSLMSESVVDTGDVEETVTQVLTHFEQGGDEQSAMSVQFLQEQVEIQLGNDEGSLSKTQQVAQFSPSHINRESVTGPKSSELLAY